MEHLCTFLEEFDTKTRTVLTVLFYYRTGVARRRAKLVFSRTVFHGVLNPSHKFHDRAKFVRVLFEKYKMCVKGRRTRLLKPGQT